MNIKFKRNPFLLFLPFLLYYVYYILKHKWPVLYGDEPRYISFAVNLLHGFYSPPAPVINLWNGPGYPIALMPFAALHLPIIFYPLLNALFYYLSIIFLYKALTCVAREKIARFFAIIWAFYFNIYTYLPAILTEIFSAFLIAAFIYSVVLFYNGGRFKHLVLSGFLLGFLTLTKIIFGYVLLSSLLVCLILLVLGKVKKNYQNSLYIILIAFITTAPYLLYTYNLTGRFFYWGNSGGMSLYWMSTPDNLEYGDWKLPSLTNLLSPQPFNTTEGDSLLKANHSAEIASILKHEGAEQDDLFKKAAIRNIRATPKKFIKNYFYNLSRMLFDFPYSYSYQIPQTIINILTGSLVFWASVVALILSVINRRRIAYAIKFIMLIFVLYFLISGLVSAYARQFDVMMPVVLFWIAYMADKLPKISLRFAAEPVENGLG
ncbi:Dolichyl-phosphate-mannose-protein mannosyltransferase [Mucilaginibacter lappiensis]|uniref:4-amino-4-deoxy-L-arabinose transferase-like glycosyltransferase n=1 Tax=Mucilaginibacter lappiensis TaxID=354630 RepID=A0ABR6PIS3_9SPHI|nr:glycosyltransferase family 39 protein [Mucilaginibacter lappiensis]MBB6109672.1 4-amino-4-deoxy-L-arabinose transferase-like glycosyltransferase [Mucilaginibacter lappiensis]SIR11301.1 Dolichyl-phosphate-mannose-protein mannosyltransferase [Mucilaginibacter lappiensis]